MPQTYLVDESYSQSQEQNFTSPISTLLSTSASSFQSFTMSPRASLPWLLYAYPWMPYPRRITIYLAEKRIHSSAIRIINVSDPQSGNAVVPSQASSVPPRPEGSLPILAISPLVESGEWVYVRQSMAIIGYVEEACAPGGALAGIGARELARSDTALERARVTEITTLAEELLVSWNPVRIFGTRAGTMVYPEGAREMFRWVQRTLSTMDSLLADRDLEYLGDDEKSVTVADIVLFGFLEFVDYCYGVDVTIGSGEDRTDVYGRVVREEYPRLVEFYELFKGRRSARRDGPGEKASEEVLVRMRAWHDGVFRA